MPKWRLIYHVIWTTKKRDMTILESIEPFLYQRIAMKCDGLGGYAFAVNGMPDHVHVITSIPPTITVARFVGELKGATSRLVSLEFKKDFQWQRGYGAFTVSSAYLNIAARYVENQKERHRTGRIKYEYEEVSEDNEDEDVEGSRS